MKHHTASLLDRYVTSDGEHLIVAQTDTGSIVDVHVDDDSLIEKAAAIWGGGCVRYTYRGPRAVFSGDVNDYPPLDY